MVVKVKSDFLVNTTVDEDQYASRIVKLANGSFVVTWTDASDDSNGTATDIRAQVFTSAGTKSGGEILVNTTTDGAQVEPTIAALTTGGFVIAWTDEEGTDGNVSGVLAQVFNASGSKVGDEFIVNQTVTL